MELRHYPPPSKVLVVASYCPAGRIGLVSLGAASKIEGVLTGLLQNGYEVILLNSGHQAESFSASSQVLLNLPAGTLLEYQLFTINWRPLGKLLHALSAPFYALRFYFKYRVSLVWIYNPYVFEVLFLFFLKLLNSPVKSILELEDMPQARRRGGMGFFKTVIDNFALSVATRLVDGLTVVQKSMVEEVNWKKSLPFWHLPVLIFTPDRQKSISQDIHVGYFGGLNEEKGADLLARVVEETASEVFWHITGVGPLSPLFDRLSKAHPTRVFFYGALDGNLFKTVYGRTHVVINLHRPLAEFGGGVFPFKFMEAVGNEKLLISTAMDGCPSEIKGAITWLDGNVFESACREVRLASFHLEHSIQERKKAASWVASLYGSKVVMKDIVETFLIAGR
ncbi:glycosyltransferase [Oleiharenicola lentus]|uniref:glycosyltransferase n=1 Tax=Oleiharenicola lentus TaxID=2508720 RepID=UPI003F67C183